MLKNKFLDIDKSVFHLFDKSNDESVLNKFKYKCINLGHIIQSNFYSYKREKINNNLSIKFLLRIFSIDHLYKLIINGFKVKNFEEDRTVVFFCEVYVPHMLDDLIKIANYINDKNETVLFLTNDIRVKQYLLKHSKLKVTIIKISLFNFIKYMFEFVFFLFFIIKSIIKNRKELKEINNTFDVPISLLLFSHSIIGYWYYKFFDIFLSLNRPKSIFMGSDAFSISRIFIDVCKSNSIKTASLQHGLIDTFNGYVPVYADKLCVWSEYEYNFLKANQVSSEKLLISGTPKVFGKLNHKKNVENGSVLIVLSIVLLKDIPRYIDSIIDFREKLPSKYPIDVRPHPYYELIIKEEFNKVINTKSNYNLNLVTTKDKIDYALSQNEFIIIYDISTVYFEALAMNKKVFVFTSDKLTKNSNKFDIYNIKAFTCDEIIDIIVNNKKYDVEFNNVSLYNPFERITNYLIN